MTNISKPVQTAGELLDALTELGLATGAFIEVDGRRVDAIHVTGLPGVDQTMHLATI